MNDRSERLALLGDRVEAAVDRDGRAGAARGRRAVLGLVAATAVVAVGLGVLAGTSGSSPPPEEVEVSSEPDQVDEPGPTPSSDPTPSTGPTPADHQAAVAVAQGMVDGAIMFEATEPSCETDDGVAFSCRLDALPTAEVADDYTGVVQTFVDDEHHIVGACRGQDRTGRTWTCLLGDAAVEAGHIGPDLLGQVQPAPGRG